MKSAKKAAIILAAGQSRRMKSKIQKQYMLLNDKPLIYYALKAFQESSMDEIILVTGKDEISQCKEQIVEYYGFDKVTQIIEGGKERYHSVYEGLKKLENSEYVLIHDGARPLITKDIIEHIIEEVQLNKACVVGMPVKDTIKIADENGIISSTPDRSLVWTIQTPQAFSYSLIKTAYDKLFSQDVEMREKITDDAMVVEAMTQYPIKLLEGSYSNIKVTTPEDLWLAKALLQGI